METRERVSLQGSLLFGSNSIVITDATDQKTTVPIKDVMRVSFLDAARTLTLTNTAWTSADIGEVFAPGATAWTNGEVTINASGWGLWRDADGLRFASVPLPGDGEIIAHVGGFDDFNGMVLAGLCIRQSLDPHARHISLVQSSKGALTFRARGDEGFTRRTLTIERSNSWLRLTRRGSRLTAYISDDAQNWSPVEGASLDVSREVRAGIFVSTEVNAFLGTAKFRDVIVRDGMVAQTRTELPAPALILRDGTVLAGQITATNDTVQLTRAGVTNEFNINGIAALLFRPVAAQVALQPSISPTTGVVMNDRDWLEGEVREFTPKGIVLGSLLFGAKTVRWSEHPAAVVLGGRTDSAAWELVLKDGSQIRAKDFSIQGERGTAHTTAIPEFLFLVAELLEIRNLKP